MSFLNPRGSLTFPSHLILLSCLGRPRSLQELAFSSGSLPPRHQCVNQFDRQPRCTAELRLGASPLLCTACRPAISQYTFPVAGCGPVSLVENDRPPSFPGAPDVWDSAAFSSIFLASSFSCSQAESQPAPAPVTQTVSLLSLQLPSE